MEEKFKEFKIILQRFVRENTSEKIKLLDLLKTYEKKECERLNVAAERFGFKTVSELIKSIPELKLIGSGLQAIVQMSDIASTHSTKKETCKHSCSIVPINGVIKQNLIPTIMPTGPKLVKTIDKIIPSCVPIEDLCKPITIQVLDVQNPHRFWFAERTEVKKLAELMTKITEFYANKDLFKVSKEELMEGLYAAVLYKNLWHRGFILKVWPNNEVRVLYVDFGTVEDVSVNHIRFLPEDFLALPATANRGILSHIQPNHGTWSEEATKFFVKNVDMKRVKAKIFKRNDRDSSYFMSIRTVGDEGELKLLANEMIERSFCVNDPIFMNKSVVTKNELEFIDYEQGKHLKDPELRLDDSWLPTAVRKSAQLNPTNDSLPSVTRHNESLKFVPTQVTSNKTLQYQINSLSPNSIVSDESNKKSTIAEPTSLKEKSIFVPQRKLRMNYSPSEENHQHKSSDELSLPSASGNFQIKEQTLRQLKVGQVMKIYIHVINDINNFYFYLKDEMLDIGHFLKDFNTAYQDNAPLNDTFETGADVVTLADENFCRGRIINNIQNRNSFKIFLLDFGVIVERPENEIFKLRETWKRRQAAVYLGQLANLPEHVYIKSRDQFEEIVSNRYVRVEISHIYDKSVELILNGF